MTSCYSASIVNFEHVIAGWLVINPLHNTGLFLCPWKYQKIRGLNVFRGYRKRLVVAFRHWILQENGEHFWGIPKEYNTNLRWVLVHLRSFKFFFHFQGMPQLTEYYIDSKKVGLFFLCTCVCRCFLYVSFVYFITDYLA